MASVPSVTVPHFRFRRGALNPPGILLKAGDVLVVRNMGLCGYTGVEVVARVLSPRLELEDYRITVLAPVAFQHYETVQPMHEGFLQGVHVVPRADNIAAGILPVMPGALYVSVLLGRGSPGSTFTFTTLCAGFVDQYGSLAWPGGRIQGPHEGPGFLTQLSDRDSAPGFDLSIAPRWPSRVRIISFRILFVTSAVAGNRNVRFRFLDRGKVVADMLAPNPQGPGVTNAYNCIAGHGPPFTVGVFHTLILPADLELGASTCGDTQSWEWSLDSVVDGIQAGDVFNTGVLQFRQWPMW